MPDDLVQRVALATATASTRVEAAVGQYQAAAGRYGAHPALQPLRELLAISGEKRVKELLVGGRCAQAQALFRALRSIAAQGKAAREFGAQCPAPT